MRNGLFFFSKQNSTFVLCCFLKVLDLQVALKARDGKQKLRAIAQLMGASDAKSGKVEHLQECNQFEMSDKNLIIYQCKFVQQIAISLVLA